MPTYDFRILIETHKGTKYSYVSQSFFNSAVNTNYAVSASEVFNRMTGSISCSYVDSYDLPNPLPGGFFKTGQYFKNNAYLSASLRGSKNTGSIDFMYTGTKKINNINDRLRRFKFFGTKVCDVLNINENFWYKPERLKFDSGSDEGYIRGDLDAVDLNILKSFKVGSAAYMASDLPIAVKKNSSRFIQFLNLSGSDTTNNELPHVDLKMGYDDTTNTYMISASARENDSTKFIIDGVTSLNVTHFTSSYVTSSVKQIFTEITSSGNSLFGDAITDTHTFNGHITASGNITASGGDFGNTVIFRRGLNIQSSSRQGNLQLLFSNNLAESKMPTIFRSAAQDGGLLKINMLKGLGYGIHHFVLSGSDDHSTQNIHVGIGGLPTPKMLSVFGDITSSGDLFVNDIAQVQHITASGNISASGTIESTGNISTDGSITTTHITASGNISASGTITADSFQSTTGGSGIDFNDSLDLTGAITASGDISASGTGIFNKLEIHGADGTLAADYIIHKGDDNTKFGFPQADKFKIQTGGTNRYVVDNLTHTFTGNITGSGTISSSGALIASSINSDAINAIGSNIIVGHPTKFASHVTATGNISSSGGFFLGGTSPGNHYISASKGNIELSGSGPASLNVEGAVTASGAISSSGTIFAHSGSFNYITASVVDVDSDTIRIGGESLNKTLVTNLKRSFSSTSVRTNNAVSVVTNVLENAISSSGATIYHPHTFSANDTTPSVKNGTLFFTANTSATAVTGLDDGVPGQKVIIFVNDGNTTFNTGANFRLFRHNSGINFAAAENDTIQLLCIDGTKWVQLGYRGDNS